MDSWIGAMEVLQLEPGRFATGVRRFHAEDEIFTKHFPGFPVVPGVIQIELIALLGGRCARAAIPSQVALLSKVKSASFFRPLEPGVEVRIHVEIDRLMGRFVRMHGSIEAGGELVSTAELQLVLKESLQ
ncbi:MAG: hypothetical protein NDJ89_02895 [Oligoflexia bacterium]|nr:hypothetical protein [Oligoflexia bacterium]